MLNFEYYAPTKVIFGKATETLVGQEIKKYGGKRVLIHYGGESARRSGLLDRVEESLRQAGIAFSPSIAFAESMTLPPPTASKKSMFSRFASSIPSLTLERRGFGFTPPSVVKAISA